MTIGMGLMTMSYGISTIFHVQVTTSLLVILMGVLVLCYTLSASSGIHRGVKILSDINIYLCIALMLFLLFVGPTRFQLNLMLEAAGSYLSEAASLPKFPKGEACASIF